MGQYLQDFEVTRTLSGGALMTPPLKPQLILGLFRIYKFVIWPQWRAIELMLIHNYWVLV